MGNKLQGHQQHIEMTDFCTQKRTIAIGEQKEAVKKVLSQRSENQGLEDTSNKRTFQSTKNKVTQERQNTKFIGVKTLKQDKVGLKQNESDHNDVVITQKKDVSLLVGRSPTNSKDKGSSKAFKIREMNQIEVPQLGYTQSSNFTKYVRIE